MEESRKREKKRGADHAGLGGRCEDFGLSEEAVARVRSSGVQRSDLVLTGSLCLLC